MWLRRVLDDLHGDPGLEGERRPAVSQAVQRDLRERRVGVRSVVAGLGSVELAAEPLGVEIVAVGRENTRSRSKSQRSITRDAAKLESDTEQRSQKGFRVGAHHRRAARAVEEREEELVAGYGEFFYAGVVCITAPTLTGLEAATEEVSQVAVAVGLEVRPLYGRHDQAMAATLPVARGLAPKGVR